MSNIPSFYKPLGQLEHFNNAQLKAAEGLVVQMERIHSTRHPDLVDMVKDIRNHLHEAHHMIKEARSLERSIRTGNTDD